MELFLTGECKAAEKLALAHLPPHHRTGSYPEHGPDFPAVCALLLSLDSALINRSGSPAFVSYT